MKIVHISDLHIDINNKKINYHRTRKVLEYIYDTGYDHLVITGDITENADNESFELARKMLKYFGILNTQKTSLIIGNHDIYGGVHLADEILSFPTRCKNTSFKEKVLKFESAFSETFMHTFQPSPNTPFPFVKEFDNFILIGLNSIAEYSPIMNPFASNGELASKQTNGFKNIFKQKKFREKKKIVLIHHHFCKDTLANENVKDSLWHKIERRTMKLRRKKSIIKLFKKHNIDLVLHGHLHESRQYTRKGLLFMNGGGTVLDSSNTFTKFNYIQIDSANNIKSHTHEAEIFAPVYAGNTSNSPLADAARNITNPKIQHVLKKEICLN